MSTLMSKYEISTNCQCRHCESCGLGTESETCDECQQPTRELTYCDGACWEYKRDWFEEDIERFIEANNNPSHVRIEGQRIGWQSRDGYLIVTADHKAIWDALTFSGEWTLKIECTGEELKVRRYSHDEPMGASFQLVAAPEGDDEE